MMSAFSLTIASTSILEQVVSFVDLACRMLLIDTIATEVDIVKIFIYLLYIISKKGLELE